MEIMVTAEEASLERPGYKDELFAAESFVVAADLMRDLFFISVFFLHDSLDSAVSTQRQAELLHCLPPAAAPGLLLLRGQRLPERLLSQ